MNIYSEKLEIMKLILETNNSDILESVKKIFTRESQTDFWEALSQSEKTDILEGIKEIDEGKIIDYEEFMKNHK